MDFSIATLPEGLKYHGTVLVLPNGTRVPWDQITSSNHKFMRLKLHGYQMYMMCSFFSAAQKLNAAERRGQQAKGRFGLLCNRLTLTSLEEGGAYHLDVEANGSLVRDIVRARDNIDNDNLAESLESVKRLVARLSSTKRGRMVSVVVTAVLANLNNIQKVDPELCARIREVHQVRLDAKEMKKAERYDATFKKDLIVRLKRGRLMAWALVVKDKYSNGEIIRQIAQLEALVAAETRGSVKRPTLVKDLYKLPEIPPLEVTSAVLNEAAVKDWHTAGGKTKEGFMCFLKKSSQVVDTTDAIIAGVEYGGLKQCYEEVKEADAPWLAYEKKGKGAVAPTIAKAPRPVPTKPRTIATKPQAAPLPTKTCRVITVSRQHATLGNELDRPQIMLAMHDKGAVVCNGEKLLGFKNLTCIADLVSKRGDKSFVYVKLGESESNVKFACEINDVREHMDMQHLDMCEIVQCDVQVDADGEGPGGAIVRYVTDTGKYWKNTRDDDTQLHWATAMARGLEGRLAKAGPRGRAPLLMQSVYLGVRLEYVDKNGAYSVVDPCTNETHKCFVDFADETLKDPATRNYASSLLETLLLSKFAGIKDLGAFNLMISKDGHVLQVDNNKLADDAWKNLSKDDKEQIDKYNSKGLLTSHQFSGKKQILLDPVRALIKTQTDYVVNMIEYMVETLHDLAAVHNHVWTPLLNCHYVTGLRSNPKPLLDMLEPIVPVRVKHA